MKNKLALATLAAVLGLCAVPGLAHATYLLTASQVGNDVQVRGSGTLNTAALNPGDNAFFDVGLNAPTATLLSGVEGSAGGRFYGLTGPASFGPGTAGGNPVLADGGAGGYMGVIGELGVLVVPLGYVSGSALTTSSTYSNTTLAALGLAPGTYTYTWGTGATADSLTFTDAVSPAAPEPSTWALLSLGTLCLGLVTLRRRHATRA